MQRVIFVSTSFGFGPASKAVTIARELRANSTVSVEFAGSGIALDFVLLAAVFDQVHHIDVDDPSGDQELERLCAGCSAVVSVMNWRVTEIDLRAPIYMVDSLTWMWPKLPNVSAVARYFVQDYLLGDREYHFVRLSHNMEIVGPIVSRDTGKERRERPQENRLLVNFAGAASPLCPDSYFWDYSLAVARAIVARWEGEFDSIRFCSNQRISDRLQQELGGASIEAASLPHGQFLDEMSMCSTLMTTPGITATIEAVRMGVPLLFLPPQNYSQALMSERYRYRFGTRAVAALSDWAGLSADFHAVSDEAQGVELTVAAVRRLVQDAEMTNRAIGGLELKRGLQVMESIRSDLALRPLGQQTISETLLRDLQASGDS